MQEIIDILQSPKSMLFPQSLDAMAEMMDKWLATRNLSADNLMWVRVYLTDPANQVAKLREHGLFADFLSHAAFSYIGQPLLNGSKMAIVFAANPKATVKKEGEPSQRILEVGDAQILLQSVRLSNAEVQGLDAQQQTELIFKRHIDWLASKGLTLKDNCMRTWLYIRDIDRNYAGVMRGRNAVFAREGLTPQTHFIASTGIEGRLADTQSVVGIDFYSVSQPSQQTTYLNALDYLNPTHEYGVAFERGVKFSLDKGQRVFISGTASIDHKGVCLYVGDVKAQVERLFLNISKLLEAANRTLDDMTHLTVYLRDVADATFAEQYVQQRFPNVPHIVVEAPVCRPGWLIEAECATN